MPFSYIPFDVNDKNTQLLLEKIFLRTKDTVFGVMEDLLPRLDSIINNHAILTENALNDIADTVMYVSHGLTILIETGRLIKDVEEDSLNELIGLRDSIMRPEGKLFLALLVKESREGKA